VDWRSGTDSMRKRNCEIVMALRSIVRKGLTVSAVSGATAGLLYLNTDRPTREAALRAARLVGTAVAIAADYQTAGWFQNQVSSPPKGTKEYWEAEIERRQEELAKAQKKYSTNNLPHLSLEERLEKKKHEKKAMMDAAEAVTRAEEELKAVGGISRRSQLHRRGAERMLQLCQTNRGVYIKVGQHLATLDYLIPSEYIEILSALFDNTPRTSAEDVAAVLKEELHGQAMDLFDRFDPEPIASASLAQVHVAYKGDKKLAVKIQHRGLRETAVGDIAALVTVVRLVERLFPAFTWGWICDEIEPLLPKELDFVNEGRNSERAAENLKITGLACVVPKVMWDLSSARVLTMEFEEGCKATDLEAIKKLGLSKPAIAKLISSVFASQIFVDGWVHCDPHPANVLLRAKPNGEPEMVLIDHGLYRELDSEFMQNYASLWKALMLADIPAIKESCKKLGMEKGYTLFAALVTARPFDEIIERSKTGGLNKPNRHQSSSKTDKTVMSGYAQQFLGEILEMLARIPRQMLLLLKTSDCLRHIDNTLGSPTNTLVVTGSYAALAVYKEGMRKASSWSGKFRVFLDYVIVSWRLQLNEVLLAFKSRS